MKQLPIFLGIIFISTSVKGQQLFGEINNLRVSKHPGKMNVYAYNDRSPFNMPGSKLLFENSMGKVYQLTPDNMRCLAPNFHSNMPYLKIQSEAWSLNGKKINPKLLPRLKIIPEPNEPLK
jgi:hypothetical protein